MRINHQGMSWMEYWIDFDTPQSDLTDELNGFADLTYRASTVDGKFLRPLDG
ncbi:hypothetical protein [Planctomicrobium piriforme]|uniref:hypothetical protein n=1 Tax=Planctomicrobium piriforme TaxID=1576369 RepID=UPI001587AA8A|nr:hypothetical protein [Planctomicrobium piriforme]